MPRRDGTGPMEQGPLTGRGFGPCGMGLGWRNKSGQGRGMGRYFSCWNWPNNKEEKLRALKGYKQALQEELEDVEQEEKDLEKQGK